MINQFENVFTVKCISQQQMDQYSFNGRCDAQVQIIDGLSVGIIRQQLAIASHSLHISCVFQLLLSARSDGSEDLTEAVHNKEAGN